MAWWVALSLYSKELLGFDTQAFGSVWVSTGSSGFLTTIQSMSGYLRTNKFAPVAPEYVFVY